MDTNEAINLFAGAFKSVLIENKVKDNGRTLY